jgi:hypothetical protein
MTTQTQQRALSEGAIALATRLSPAQIVEILREDCRRGVAERTPDGWRLSRDAERRFGPALRALGDEQVELGWRGLRSR